LRANGSRECAPDDRLREAIHRATKVSLDCFVASAPLRKRFAFVAGNDDATATLRRDDFLPLFAQPLNAERDDVADIEEFRRFHAHADPRRRASRDHVAGHQCH
jgi:hypothetical protein